MENYIIYKSGVHISVYIIP